MQDELIKALSQTGEFLEKYCKHEETNRPEWKEKLDNAIIRASLANPWFIKDFITISLQSVSSMLRQDELRNWLSAYPELNTIKTNSCRVGVISAGNIPLVGFHDFLCVLVSGQYYIGKLSAQDNTLLPVIADFIIELFPQAKDRIRFPEGKLEWFDKIIATGSNNTARYFEYYFRNYPTILRKNRNSLAILSGNETSEELELLGDDIFLYFGLGCRNVSKVFVPEGYDLTKFFPCWTKYAFMEHHNKYHNNYSYYKSIYLVNRDEHLDNGYLLVKKEENQMVSPVSVLFVEEYTSLPLLQEKLKIFEDQIQCIVGRKEVHADAVPFGNAQFPGLKDYADGIDTLEFLLKK